MKFPFRPRRSCVAAFVCRHVFGLPRTAANVAATREKIRTLLILAAALAVVPFAALALHLVAALAFSLGSH